MARFPPPSTYTPLFRRFGSEKNRELREVRDLYHWVAVEDAAFESERAAIFGRFVQSVEDVPKALSTYFTKLIASLTLDLPAFDKTPEPDFARMSMEEFVEYRNFLYAKQHFYQNKPVLVAHMQEAFDRICGGLIELLPEADAPSPFTVPLVCCLPDPGDVIQGLSQILGQYHALGLFQPIARQIYINLCQVSGREPGEESRRPLRQPIDSDLPPVEMIDAYLKHTPFHDFFMAPVPLKLTYKDRFNHWHVLAGSGQGKTVLIENLIRYDLASEDPPSIVLIDPHSDLVRKLVRSDLGIEDRLILTCAANCYAVEQDQRKNSICDSPKPVPTANAINTERAAGAGGGTLVKAVGLLGCTHGSTIHGFSSTPWCPCRTERKCHSYKPRYNVRRLRITRSASSRSRVSPYSRSNRSMNFSID